MCIDGKQDTPLAERWQTPEPLLNEDDADDDAEDDAEDDDDEYDDEYGMETPRAATTPASGAKKSSVSFAATTPGAVESVRQSLAKMRYADTSPTIISRFIYVCM